MFYELRSQITFILILAYISIGTVTANSVRQLPAEGEFSITPEVGTFFSNNDKFVNGDPATASIGDSGLPQIAGIVVSPGLRAKAENQSFDDVFDIPVSLGVTLNYGLSSSSEIFGRLQYVYASADKFDYLTFRTAGTIFSGPINNNPDPITPIPVVAGDVIEGEFDDYKEYGIDLGYRYFFSTESNFRPFASVTGGIRYIEALELDYIAPNGESIGKAKFYDDSTVFSAGLGIGFRYSLSPTIALGLETGISYQDKLDDEDLQGGGPDDLNDGGNRWQIPLYIGLNVLL